MVKLIFKMLKCIWYCKVQKNKQASARKKNCFDIQSTLVIFCSKKLDRKKSFLTQFIVMLDKKGLDSLLLIILLLIPGEGRGSTSLLHGQL
jgi:hypothetical protein